jgi:hypothetical protein
MVAMELHRHDDNGRIGRVLYNFRKYFAGTNAHSHATSGPISTPSTYIK